MSKASRAREEYLKNAKSLKYGDFEVTKDWKYAANPLRGHGGANYVAFNPNDPTQKFATDGDDDFLEYLGADVQREDYVKYGLSSTADPSGRYESVFAMDTIQKQAEQKRLKALSDQMSAGTLSVAEGNKLANTKQITPLTPGQEIYNTIKANQTTPGSGTIPKTFDNITPISTPTFSLSSGNLNVGSTGSDVSKLQEYLNFATGSNLKVDGQYGAQTQNAVKQLQSRLGITADGIVGSQTTKALNDYLAKILKANPNIQAPTSINSSNLQTGTSTNLPSRNTTTSSGADSLIGGVNASQSELEKAQAKTEKQYNELEGEISKLLGNSVGQGQAQQNAEAVAGVPGLEQELSNLNAQIKVGLAEYQIEKDKYDALSLENRNKPVTMNSIIGSEAAIDFARQQALNRKASDIGLLQAQASGVAGNLELAQNTANKAVELKYADIKTMLDVKMQQLSILGDKLSREEKKTADFLNRQYEMQKAEIDAQEADEKALNNFTLDAMQNYRSAGIRLGDSYETIQSKILGSSEYRAEQTKATTKTATEADKKDDIASAVIDFQNQIKQKGWSGANPDAYDYYRNELIKLYGSSAALELDKAMLDAGISVDYENK